MDGQTYEIASARQSVASDLMRFLGTLSLGYMVLTAWDVYEEPAQEFSRFVLAFANGPQFVRNPQAHLNGR